MSDRPLSPPRCRSTRAVPNVVYSCGSLKVGNQLMIPFGIADQSIGFATANVNDILERLA